MAQHDYNIANGSGLTVRNDINDALNAVVTANSGPTEPATMFSNMFWYDTTSGVLKMRNNANNAWQQLRHIIGDSLYPVGSIYVNANNATNPATLLGFGTWVAFGAGRVMVGLNAADPLFDTAEETGGSKDAVVVSHTHTGTTASSGAHTHLVVANQGNTGAPSPATGPTVTGANSVSAYGWSANSESYILAGTSGPNAGLSSSSGAHTHSITTDSSGSSATNANLQPYITVYMWKRTA